MGIHIPERHLLLSLAKMKSHLGDQKYTAYTQNQSIRDDGGYHMTILDAKEIAMADPSIISGYVGKNLWIRVIGLGRQTAGEHETYYSILECEAAQRIRNRLGFGLKDMHATLGFRHTDIHNIPKGESTVI